MSLQTLSGKQIRAKSITDLHIASKLSESVLDIRWEDPAHAQAILKNKSITDYIQFGSALEVLQGESEKTIQFALDVSTVTVPGVIVGEPLRFRTDSGDILSHDGKEVKAIIKEKVSGSAGAFDYKIAFYQADGLTPYVFEEALRIEFLYPVKTTLWDAVENFASNERFVDGAIDIATKMKVEQLVADIFGEGYDFTGNGSASLGETIVAMFNRLTQGTVNQDVEAPEIIDEVVAARGGKENLDARFKAVEKLSKDINNHYHGKDAIKLLAEQTEFALGTDFTKLTVSELATTDILDVYVNGQLQEEVLNYTLTKDVGETYVTGFAFSEPLVTTDVVSIRWTISIED